MQNMNEKLNFSLPDEINPLQRAEAIRPAPINPTFISDFTWYSCEIRKKYRFYDSTCTTEALKAMCCSLHKFVIRLELLNSFFSMQTLTGHLSNS